MERRLDWAPALPRRIATLAATLGVSSLGLAGAALLSTQAGVAGWFEFLLGGSALLAAGAAGSAVSRRPAAVAAEDVDLHRELADVLADCGDGVWDYDIRAGRISYNAACATMLGYDEDIVPSTMSTWGMLVHEDDLPTARAALDDYLSGRAAEYRVNVRLRRKDGTWLRVVDTGRVVTRDSEGRPRRAIGVHRALATDAARGDVAAVVTSDLDAALAGLLGQTRLASPTGENSELERAAWRCVGLARRLKLVAGEESETPVPTDVVALARSAVQDAERWASKRLLLRVSSERNVGAAVLSSAVFASLLRLALDEAIEHADMQGGTIDVSLAKAAGLVVKVTTSPVGRAAESTQRMSALRGLGTRHGVDVSSEPGAIRLAWRRQHEPVRHGRPLRHGA